MATPQQPPTEPSPAVQQTQTAGASPQKKSKSGCGVGAVIMVAALMFVVGLIAGAAGAIGYFIVNPDSLGALGVDLPQKVVVKEHVVTKTEKAASADYALLYPIEESLQIEGPVPKSAVTKQVKDKRYALRKCYQEGLDRTHNLKGEMGVQFTINGSTGKVVAAVERHTNFPDGKVKSCIIHHIKNWKFPGKKDRISVVKFDMLLIPIGSGDANKLGK